MTTPIPKDEIKVLSQEIFPDVGFYRLLAGRVRYITMPTTTLDEDTMCRPYLFIPALPDIPDGEWTEMYIEKDGNGFKTCISYTTLDAVYTVWHPNLVDVLTLPKCKVLNKRIYETKYLGKPTMMKIANFPYDVGQIEDETWAYSMLNAYEQNHPELPPLTPKFLGHLVEHGRVIGFLLEKVEGRGACLDDLAVCKDLIARVHDAGLVHGDVNRYNFMINDQDPARSCILDFEHSEPFDQTKATEELESLVEELNEETGRGKALV